MMEFVKIMKILVVFLCFMVFSASASLAEYFYAADSDVVGNVYKHTVKKGESLIEIARMFNLGYNEIMGANPDLDPFVPPVGQSVRIPMTWIIPDVVSRNGIVINISEMRLFFFLGQGTNLMTTFPIGVGDEGNETPMGSFKIIQKIVKPSWSPPKSIREERPELPKVVPPGPENPLGTHAMRLSMPSVLIHGTNRPWAVGRRATHGCLRLYPEDIPRLFQLVKKGEKVTIVRQPVKVGVRENRVYMEVHDDGKVNYLREAVSALGRKGLLDRIDRKKMMGAIKEKSGIPVDISSDSLLVRED
jgi:L,D-transpeptidase ErfK/SrfK